jgi:hypothetical protein
MRPPEASIGGGGGLNWSCGGGETLRVVHHPTLIEAEEIVRKADGLRAGATFCQGVSWAGPFNRQIFD